MRNKKNILCLICVFIIAFTMAGCGGRGAGSSNASWLSKDRGDNSGSGWIGKWTGKDDSSGENKPGWKRKKGEDDEKDDTNGTTEEKEPETKTEIETETEKNTEIETTEYAEPEMKGKIENASFLMIYNPLVFDEYSSENYSTVLYTGDISSQIQTGINRADGLETGNTPNTISQKELNEKLGEVKKKNPNRSVGMDPVYKEGDIHQFYKPENETIDLGNRVLTSFTCMYAGEHCYIWDCFGYIDDAAARSIGQEFDSQIYNVDVDEFGQARFTKNGGKVNILFFPMIDYLGGYFWGGDLFSSSEVSWEVAEAYGFNTDHAIININVKMLSDMSFMLSTLSHEFQHLICETDSYEKGTDEVLPTWLNEGMSAYAEELIYPGVKWNHHYDVEMYKSENYREGQSLYNFGDGTIGTYGVVYLFEEYLRHNAGEDVFSKVHSNWRESPDSTPDQSKLLYNSASSEYRDYLNERYKYPVSLENRIGSTEKCWMSKMAMDFYLQALTIELSQNTDACHRAMIYSDPYEQDIEGGGRLIVALKDGTFTIPDSADPGLVYIGLDKDFQPVTDLIIGE